MTPLANPVSQLQLQLGGAQVSKGLKTHSAAKQRVQGGAAAGTKRNVRRGWASSLPAERPHDAGVGGQRDAIKSKGLNPAPKGLKLPDDAASKGAGSTKG